MRPLFTNSSRACEASSEYVIYPSMNTLHASPLSSCTVMLSTMPPAMVTCCDFTFYPDKFTEVGLIIIGFLRSRIRDHHILVPLEHGHIDG